MKSILSVLLAIIVAVSCAGCGLNADVSQREGPYEETHFQVNFGELEVDTSNGQFRVSEPMPAGSGEQGEQTEELKMLAELCEKYPDIEENLVRDFNEGELAAVSFTVVPLEKVGNHYERVPETRGSASSDKDKNGTFVLYTTVNGGTLEVPGGYQYAGRSYSTWDNGTLTGGSKYPDLGDDYVLQAGPSTFVMTDDFLVARYNSRPTSGEEGEDFHCESGGGNFIRYAIDDYTSQERWLKEASLVCTYAGPSSTEPRKISSCYVHTWKSMIVDISVEAGPLSSVFTVTPKVTDASWQVFNYVTFNF